MNLIQILADQREERDALDTDACCKRSQEKEIDVNSQLAQVVVGMRRSGKTTLCHQVLRSNKINYAYINFDDEALATLDASQLSDLLQAAYVAYGDFKHIFLDEIQNVEGWELFVNRLLRQGYRVILTGSNSNLLSFELGSHLTGRYKEIELLPLSFREYLDFQGIPPVFQSTREKARCLEAYCSYSRNGGLPEVYKVSDMRSYVKTLYNAILFKDVTKRYNVRYPRVLSSLSAVMLENICQEVNYTDIAKALSVKSVHTLQNYVGYLEKAYLFRLLPKFSFKPLKRQSPEKAYVVDLGIYTAFSGVTLNADNEGWRMENLVFLKLYSEREKKDYELYYWANGCEVDFVLVRKQKVLSLIQVAYDISSAKTRQREINALLKASVHLHCDELLLVTLTEKSTYTHDGKNIKIIPIVEFLLS